MRLHMIYISTLQEDNSKRERSTLLSIQYISKYVVHIRIGRVGMYNVRKDLGEEDPATTTVQAQVQVQALLVES